MPNENNVPSNGARRVLLETYTITAAETGTTPGNGGAAGVTQFVGAQYVGLFAKFVYGSGGTTAKAWVQTSFDGGTTWVDIANFAFTTASLNKVAAVASMVAATHATPTDATLADNTINNGLIGDRLRVKLTTTGTYAGGTTLRIVAIVKG